MEKRDKFKIIGIAVATSNANGQAAEDLAKLWERFFTDNIPSQIPNIAGNEIYAIYTDYESDYRAGYTAIIGMKVSNLETIPEGMIGREFGEDTYKKFTAKGSMPEAIVKTWTEIWANDEALNRKYNADFEIYGEKAQQGDNSEVEIYISVNK